MDLTVRSETLGVDSPNWLGSEKGTDTTDSITLDGALLGAVFTDGVVPSGVALGLVTATGRYGPYNDAASDGTQTAVGFLFTTQRLNNIYFGDSSSTYHNVSGALLWEGEVVVAKLPANNGLDTAGKADLAGKFRFV